MPRIRNPNRNKAFELYKKSNGTIDLIEIAKQLNLSAGTVRGWKSKDKWDEKVNGTFQKNMECSKTCNEEKENIKQVVEIEVEQVIRNPELTDKQRLFCLFYIKSFNATKAYQKAYHCNYTSAMQNGSRLLRNEKVKGEILRLKQACLNREFLSESDIFQKYMDIAFSDITDYVNFGQKEIKFIDKSNNEKTQKVNYIDLKESKEIDGTLITEISQGKEGIKIKLADKMKALEWLSFHMNMATEEQKARISKIKIQTDKMKAEQEKEKEEEIQVSFEKASGENEESENETE